MSSTNSYMYTPHLCVHSLVGWLLVWVCGHPPDTLRRLRWPRRRWWARWTLGRRHGWRRQRHSIRYSFGNSSWPAILLRHLWDTRVCECRRRCKPSKCLRRSRMNITTSKVWIMRNQNIFSTSRTNDHGPPKNHRIT